MELLPLFGSLALLLGLLLYLGRPLLLDGQTRAIPPGGGARELFERKEQLLGAIVELELDREIGKVPEEDFQRLFAQLEAEALVVIGELDQLNGAGSDELESRIEAEVAALRQTAAKPSCPGCGALRREDDRFCPQCGVAFAESS